MKSTPNILVLLAEDICPDLACYGTADAITPNLDTLAKEGVLYTHANSVAPVCSAARTSLVLGMYPCSAGVGNHRSCVDLPEHIKVVSKYMQENRYYCATNKTDYNFYTNDVKERLRDWDAAIPGIITADDESLSQAIADTWKKRGEKPFFLMSTFACTHQSRYGFPDQAVHHRKSMVPRIKEDEYQDREELSVPEYHFDNKETREIWGQYHETITAMDRMVGETIQKLKEDNLYDETIIIFLGDNGMGIPGGKSNMWNEGTHVPMIVRIPAKYMNLADDFIVGGIESKAISFVDIAPTLINIAGGTIPTHMHGKNFLKRDQEQQINKSFSYRNRIDTVDDFVRVLKTDDYLYIRNFYPHRAWRFSSYMKRMAPYFTVAWEQEARNYSTDYGYDRKKCFCLDEKPVEELYDLKNDPEQLHNLYQDERYQDVLLDLRQFQGKLVDMLEDENASVRMASAEAIFKWGASQDCVKRAEGVMHEMLQASDLITILKALMCVTRNHTKMHALIPSIEKIIDAIVHGELSNSPKILQAIEDMANYTLELMGHQLEYNNPDEKLHKRLLVLRALNHDL